MGHPNRMQDLPATSSPYIQSQNQTAYMQMGNSSVNSTITNNAQDFPLGRPFYADFTHDDIIISTLTSMSVDYFREHPNLQQYPPDPERHFILSNMTPFGGRLITEVIGCADANPDPVQEHSRCLP